ncbi:hypothetical protein JQ629_07065 [Bradyrhizobium sp. AUGA SZCCT0222]|uniref:hypothetical protein n=1 Tax=Bradyrhizobium sp. AUGA SZCCT0222 TaxID=2807668 RepID=UPI001BA5F13C|nr:hypothetical protein [Bradyrhizobium sp. AUGA SZCCT0222]MBR1267266.1 hypothetical protein [Bradyrhizobium sp. AUGA SZCCT0222]
MAIAPDAKAKAQWNVLEGTKVAGGMYATSTDGQVTGFRAGRLVGDGFQGAILIDDPIKPANAESDVLREHANTQLAQTVRSRRARPDTPIVCIMQRLHERDVSGFLLEEDIGEPFEHLKIRALDDAGKSYWEIKEPAAQLLSFAAKQPYIFSGQYQQDPTPEQGRCKASRTGEGSLRGCNSLYG